MKFMQIDFDISYRQGWGSVPHAEPFERASRMGKFFLVLAAMVWLYSPNIRVTLLDTVACMPEIF